MIEGSCWEWATKRRACAEALEWLGTLNGAVSVAGVWDLCRRSDWMLWMLDAAELCLDSYALHEFACYVAEAAARRMIAAGHRRHPGDVAAIKAKRMWLLGEIDTLELEAIRVRAVSTTATTAAMPAALGAAEETAHAEGVMAAVHAAEGSGCSGRRATRAQQADLLRRLMGNPFRPRPLTVYHIRPPVRRYRP